MALRRCACGVLMEDGRILLGKRAPHRELYPSAWDMVGGHQEAGETLDQTLVREFEEEIDVTPMAFEKRVVIVEPRSEENGERDYHVYAITRWHGPGPQMCGDEHTALDWFTIGDALGLDLALAEYRDVLRRL